MGGHATSGKEREPEPVFSITEERGRDLHARKGGGPNGEGRGGTGPKDEE